MVIGFNTAQAYTGFAAERGGYPVPECLGNAGCHAPAAIRIFSGGNGAMIGLAAQRARARFRRSPHMILIFNGMMTHKGAPFSVSSAQSRIRYDRPDRDISSPDIKRPFSFCFFIVTRLLSESIFPDWQRSVVAFRIRGTIRLHLRMKAPIY